MNLFVTHQNPAVSVQHLDDVRLRKMVLETAQILSTCMHLRGEWAPYKPTHINHPVVQWANSNDDNLDYVVTYFINIDHEYRFRFNKRHKSTVYVNYFCNRIRQTPTVPNYFVNCTPFKDELDVFKAYQKTLLDKWSKDKIKLTWTKRVRPDFKV